MNSKISTLFISVALLGASVLARAAEFPVYFESSTESKNFVTISTKTKEWRFDGKTRRVERTVTIGSKVINATDIVKDGLMHTLYNQKRTIHTRVVPKAEVTTMVHAFTPEELKKNNMSLAGSEIVEGQDCEKWTGDTSKAQPGHSANLVSSSSTTYWIRKSDHRLIRIAMTVGAASTSTITYRNISTDPALFKQSLLDIPMGYKRR